MITAVGLRFQISSGFCIEEIFVKYQEVRSPGRLKLHNRPEATVDQTTAIEGRGVFLRIHTIVLEIVRHHRLHGGIARFLVRPFDPGEHNRFICLRLN